MLKLQLVKADVKPVILTLNKSSKFIAELYWNSKHDVDVHALALNQNGSLDDDAGRILSSYNTACVLQSDGVTNIVAGTKKPFQNPLGYLNHEGDKRSGVNADESKPEETIVIDVEKVPSDIEKIIFAVSIHPPTTATFSQVKDARLVIKDDNGAILIDAELTSDFDQYSVITLGGIVKEEGTWKFSPKAIGYDKNDDGSIADFNTIIIANNG